MLTDLAARIACGRDYGRPAGKIGFNHAAPFVNDFEINIIERNIVILNELNANPDLYAFLSLNLPP